MKQILKTKAFYRLMPVLATIMLSSCNKEDGPIEGTWNLISIMGAGVVFPPSSIGIEYFIVTFSSNGTYILQKKTLGSDATDPAYGTYTLSGKSLSIFEQEGDVVHWTIKSITKNQMILVNTDSDIEQTWTFARVN